MDIISIKHQCDVISAGKKSIGIKDDPVEITIHNIMPFSITNVIGIQLSLDTLSLFETILYFFDKVTV